MPSAWGIAHESLLASGTLDKQIGSKGFNSMPSPAINHGLIFRAVAVSLALLGSSICSASTPWHTPAKGSNERAQIMDALRARLATYDATHSGLIFVVKELCVSPAAGWLAVEAQSRDGKNRLEAVHASLNRGTSGWRVETIACGEQDCPKSTDPEALRARVNPLCESRAK